MFDLFTRALDTAESAPSERRRVVTEPMVADVEEVALARAALTDRAAAKSIVEMLLPRVRRVIDEGTGSQSPRLG